MSCRQRGKLHAAAGQEGVVADEKGVGSFAHDRCKGCVDFAAGAGVDDLNLQSHGASSRLHVPQRGATNGRIHRIDEHGNASGSGHQLAQDFQPLCNQLVTEKIDPCQVAARLGQAGDITKPDRVVADDKHNGNRRGRCFGYQRGASARNDHGDLAANKIGRQLRQPVDSARRPAVFDRHVLTFDKALAFQTLAKCAHTLPARVGRRGHEKADRRHRRLLSASRSRPRRHSATEKRDELPPPHSITSSARASNAAGIWMPSVLAVCRLMTNSNFVGSWTGISAGFSPLRIRPA